LHIILVIILHLLQILNEPLDQIILVSVLLIDTLLLEEQLKHLRLRLLALVEAFLKKLDLVFVRMDVIMEFLLVDLRLLLQVLDLHKQPKNIAFICSFIIL